MLDQQYEMDKIYEIEEKEKSFSETALYQNFTAGNLLYGRDIIRRKYTTDLSEKINKTHNITTNQYNNYMCDNGELIALNSNSFNGRNIKAAEEYYNYFQSHPNYKKFTPDKIEESKLKDRGLRSETFLLLLYSCRAAIECSQFQTIHFCLDGVDLKNVQEKIRPAIKSQKIKKPIGIDYRITTSELRFIYKNWDTLKDKVKFYQKGEAVDCPWEGETASKEWKTNFLNTEQAKAKLGTASKISSPRQHGDSIENAFSLKDSDFYDCADQAKYLIFRNSGLIELPQEKKTAPIEEEKFSLWIKEKSEHPISAKQPSKTFQFLNQNTESPAKFLSTNETTSFLHFREKSKMPEINLKDKSTKYIINDSKKKKMLPHTQNNIEIKKRRL